jgi:hypothetical protein
VDFGRQPGSRDENEPAVRDATELDRYDNIGNVD